MKGDKKYAVLYEDGKLYTEAALGYLTWDEAERELKESIEYMEGDNWCGLHIEEIKNPMEVENESERFA